MLRHLNLKKEDKDKNNKLMSFGIDDEQIIETYKSICTKIEYIKNIELRIY